MTDKEIREYLIQCICAEKENKILRKEIETLKEQLYKANKTVNEIFYEKRDLIQMMIAENNGDAVAVIKKIKAWKQKGKVNYE